MSAAPLKARLGALRRRVLGTGPAPEVQARLDHHDQALRDITAALQQVQAVVPPPGSERAAGLAEVQRRVDVLEEHLPELLGLWSSATGTQRRLQRQLDDRARSLDQHATSIEELWQRIEFVRREVLYELRYHDAAAAGAPAGDLTPAEVRVVDADRVQQLQAEHGLRLNLGCGHLPIDGYVNVDMRELPGVDVVAPIDQLPFDEGVVDEIHSAHVLEHFPQEDLERRLLPYWHDRLRPGGVFRATVPDGVAMLDGYAKGEIPFEDLRSVLYGGQEYEGDFHFTMFGAETLTELLARAGFTEVEVEAQGRPNDICLELQVAARRPE